MLQITFFYQMFHQVLFDTKLICIEVFLMRKGIDMRI